MESQKERIMSNPWGSQDDDCDDETILAVKTGKRCSLCGRVILNIYLRYKDKKPYCPDCVKK